MDTKNWRRLLMVSLISLGLAGCSSEDPAPNPDDPNDAGFVNTAPSVTVEFSTLSVEEGSVTRFAFTLTDATDPFEDIELVITNDDLIGVVTIDRANKELVYSAPWLQDKASVSTGFTLTARDSNRLESIELNVGILISDISSIASVVVSPSNQAFGFERTQTDTTISPFIFESAGFIDLTYRISDEDSDDIDFTYEVDGNGIFYNDIQRIDDAGDVVRLRVPINNINVPSSDIVLRATINDGDGQVEALSTITIVNEVTPTFLSTSDAVISEESGGEISWSTNESNNYPLNTKVDVTYQDGSEIDFDLPYSVDINAGKIVFGKSAGFINDKSLRLTLTFSNELRNAGDDIFIASSQANFNFTVSDDRDDVFFDEKESFFSNITKFNEVLVREDEKRVLSSVSSFLLLNDKITLKEKRAIEAQRAAAFSVNATSIENLENEVQKAIEEDRPFDIQKDLFSQYEAQIKLFGEKERELIHDFFDEIKLENPDIVLENIILGGALRDVNSSLTHYVGNLTYGNFDDENQSLWVFKSTFKYLDVVNITDAFCF